MKTLRAFFILIVFGATAFGQIKPPPALPPIPMPATETAAEVDEAFKDFDFDKLAINPNNLTAQAVKDLRESFLPAVKPLILNEGDYPNRLKRIAAPVLRFHQADKSETTVFTHAVPIVLTWKETFITFSTAALDLLSDDEIAALVSHEIGHLYFAESLAKARDEKDDRAARVIELRCDLIALATLAKLGIKESKLLSAVEKLIEKRKELKFVGVQAGGPSLENRRRIAALHLKHRKKP